MLNSAVVFGADHRHLLAAKVIFRPSTNPQTVYRLKMTDEGLDRVEGEKGKKCIEIRHEERWKWVRVTPDGMLDLRMKVKTVVQASTYPAMMQCHAMQRNLAMFRGPIITCLTSTWSELTER